MEKLLLQAIKFVGISGIGWIIDFCLYTVLGFFSSNLVLNNFISSWAGVTFVFLFATRKVFVSNSKLSLKAKYVIYLLYQFILILVISKLLGGVNTFIVDNIGIDIIVKCSSIISKIVITPITMVINFFVMRFVIEKL